jgi:hypothetical protein
MMRAFALAWLCLAATHVAQAQEHHLFVGGGLVVDAKRFSGDPSSNTLDGTALGGAIEAGVLLTEHVSLRLQVGVDGKTTASTPIPIGVLALPVGVTVPITAFRSDVSNRVVATSVLVGYQMPVGDRIHVGASGGLSFLHVTRQYTTTGPVPLSAADAAVIALVVRPYTIIDEVPAATVGGEIVFDVTRHFAAVGRLDAHAFSLGTGGPSGVAIRPGLGARWIF